MPVSTVQDLKNTWRWLVCGLDGHCITNFDKLATNVSMQFVLDDISQMTCDLPSDNVEVYKLATDGEPFVSYGRRLLYGLRREEPGGAAPWVPRWSGIINILQDQAASDEPVTHLTSYDSWQWAKALPVLMPDGSLPPEKGVVYTGMRGDQIVKDVILNAYGWIVNTAIAGGFGNTPGIFPWNGFAANASGLFIDINAGHFDHTDTIPTITFQQGATVYDAWTQLCQTGGLDVVLTPIYHPRSKPGVLSVLNVYNLAGSDKPGAVFGWDMFPRDLVGIDDLRDGTQIENWAQFYAGGLVATNPNGNGHPFHYASNSSIHSYGPYFVQKNYSGPSEGAAVGLLSVAEIALREKGKQTLQVSPAPERAPDPFTVWYLGDTIYAWAGRPMAPFTIPGGYGSALRAGVRSPQVSGPSPHRVYGFQVDLADNQVETITNLLLSDPNAQSL